MPMRFMANEPKTCGSCGCPIRKGAQIVAIVSMVLLFIYMLRNLISGVYGYTTLCFGNLIYLAVLYGIEKDKSGWLLLYVIGHGIGIVVNFIGWIAIVVMLLVGDDRFYLALFGSDLRSSRIIIILIFSLIMAIELTIHCWLYSVVYRAYKFIKNFVEPEKRNIVVMAVQNATSQWVDCEQGNLQMAQGQPPPLYTNATAPNNYPEKMATA